MSKKISLTVIAAGIFGVGSLLVFYHPAFSEPPDESHEAHCPQLMPPSPEFEDRCRAEGGIIKPHIHDNCVMGYSCEKADEKRIPEERSCDTDEDCSCGRHRGTGECFIGNRQYVVPERPCPDFCSGISGNLTIRCINNECKQHVHVKGSEDQKNNCSKEGGSIPVIPNAPPCCEGLTLIKTKSPNILGSKGVCTSRCGNGVCDSETETVYNCPKDCKSTAYRDVPFGFHTGNAFPKDISAHNPDNPLDPEIWGKYEYAQDIGAGWERPGMYAWMPPQKSGLSWRQLTDRIYSTVPALMRIFANIDVRAFTYTRPSKKPEELKNLTIYHPPVSYLELFDEKLYIQFVRDLVERSDGDGVDDMPGLKNPVKYWQIDNELPGLPPFELNSSNQAENDKWIHASINNYAHVLEITSKAIKSSDPSAKIALSGMADIGPGTAGLFREYYLGVLKKLKYGSVDIFDYHFYGDAKISWKTMKDAYHMIREGLDSIGYKDMDIWITETGTYTGRPRDGQGYSLLQTEKEQAMDLARRMIYPITFGVKKVFWAWGIMDCAASEGPDGHMGLIYNGKGPGNPGYGVKKLSYYTYKKLVEVLEGSDWNNIQTLKEEQNDAYGIFLFKFVKNGKPIYVGWSSCFYEQKCNSMKIDLRTELVLDKNAREVKITESVPKYESGNDVIDYDSAFNSETKKVDNGRTTIFLKEVPVFVEEIK